MQPSLFIQLGLIFVLATECVISRPRPPGIGRPVPLVHVLEGEDEPAEPAAVSEDLVMKGLFNIVRDINAQEDMECAEWSNRTTEKLGLTNQQLAKIITDGNDLRLAMEFMTYCLLDDVPLAERLVFLKEQLMNGQM